MTRIRILFTIPNLITAGSKFVILNILERLDRDIFEPMVCVLKRGGIEAKFEESGIRVFSAPFAISMRPRRTLLWRAWQRAEHFRKLEIDIWHSWHYLDDYSEPVIARMSGTRKWGYTKKNMSWGTRAWQVRSLLADYIVVDNSQMLDRFFASRLYQRKLLKTITHGVNSKQFRPCPEAPCHLRKALAIPEDAIVIACVAAIIKIKDHATLIRAVAQVASPVFVLLIGEGDPTHQESVFDLVEETGLSEHVHFLGWQSNDALPSILNEADIFVLSSRSEAFGVALIEAMACGLSSVATRCGGPETIIDDGKDGFLVPVGDHRQLADALQRLLNDPELRRRMGIAARRKVVKNFSIDREIRQYEDLYRHDLWQ